MSIVRSFTSGLSPSLIGYAPQPLLLDTLSVQPVAAWSMHRLRASYAGPCVRIGGSDIGFNRSDVVNATSGTVQRWYDQMGGGYFATASGVQSLGVDSVTGQLQLTGDGAGNMVSSGNINLSGATAATIVVAVRNNQRLSIESVLEQGNISSAGLAVFTNDSTSYTLGNAYGSTGGVVLNNTPVLDNVAKSYGFVTILKPLAAGSDDRARIRLDGADVDEAQAAVSGTPDTSGFINAPFTLLGRTSTFQSLASVSTVLIFNQELGSTDIAKIEAWLASNWSDNHTVPASLDNSMTSVSRSGYTEVSALSTITFQTRATKLGVRAHESIFTDSLAKIGVYVNGSYYSQLSYGYTQTIQEQIATLPAGLKTVKLVSGITSDLSRDLNPYGVFLQSVRANAPLSRQSVSTANTTLAIGDSLTVGQAADPVMRDSWVMRLRNAASYPVSVHGMGFANVYDYAGDSTKRTAFMAKLAQYSPSRFIIALGTNDYQLAPWNAASFGTAYAALLDAIHSAYPSASVYCITPPTLSTETANAAGSTAANYRTQISNAVSSRGSYATLISGPAICSAADLTDGVHGNSNWHASYYAGVAAAVGL